VTEGSDTMVRRRDLLRASLSVCSCATCGVFGIGLPGGSARADGPAAISGTGYQLWFIGAQRETIMKGKLAAVLDLKTLAGRPHLYGLGPIEQLRGEVTIADSRPALARVAPDGTVNVTRSFHAGVPFFVWAEVPRWIKVPIRRSVPSKTLDALSREQPRLPASMQKNRRHFWLAAVRI
jgi:hypothetical protein